MSEWPPLDAIDVPLGLYLFLAKPQTWVAVIFPGLLSLLILMQERRERHLPSWLVVVWAVTLPLSFGFAYWESNGDREQLTIMSTFSIAAMIWVWRGYQLTAPVAFALTFFGLLLVDVLHAVLHARASGLPFPLAYYGVGGAGIWDALFVVPYLTAAAVAYAALRQRQMARRAARAGLELSKA